MGVSLEGVGSPEKDPFGVVAPEAPEAPPGEGDSFPGLLVGVAGVLVREGTGLLLREPLLPAIGLAITAPSPSLCSGGACV